MVHLASCNPQVSQLSSAQEWKGKKQAEFLPIPYSALPLFFVVVGGGESKKIRN